MKSRARYITAIHTTKLSVTIKIPSKTRNNPPTMDTQFKYLPALTRYFEAHPMARAASKKGIARPTENTVRSKAPVPTVADEAAKVRMVARIGPTHGVHPKAKVTPKRKELRGLPGLNFFPTDNWRSRAKKLKRGIYEKGIFPPKRTLRAGSIKKSPKKITSAPPNLVMRGRYCKNAAPPRPNKLPRIIKTTLKPKT
tara:strand:- start:112 stop:702 length:591 start_codon:yes stop_codon:yes gene_type:complete